MLLTFLQVGLISLLFRQTNIVWVATFAAIGLIREIRSVSGERIADPVLHEVGLRSGMTTLLALIRAAMLQWRKTLKTLAIYSPVGFISVLFLYWNGSIVLGNLRKDIHRIVLTGSGDKSMHRAGFFPIQVMYMTSFAVVISAPLFLHRSSLMQVVHGIRRPSLVAALLPLCLWAAGYKRYLNMRNITQNLG